MKLYDLIGVLPEKTTIGNTEAEIADLEIKQQTGAGGQPCLSV